MNKERRDVVLKKNICRMQLENRYFFYIHNTPSTPKARRLEPGNLMGQKSFSGFKSGRWKQCSFANEVHVNLMVDDFPYQNYTPKGIFGRLAIHHTALFSRPIPVFPWAIWVAGH